MKNDHITIPLFADFIRSVVQKELDSPLVYDETTNTIKRGLTVISDNLTGAEFRLLRLLLQNKDRVVERDEVVGAVWQENTSIAGVSEQAIDQLVFRLRKKIEADPNHPELIQTIKGRGIKLQSI
jgi:two-component system phosphate regulon response regulator PhoB/two-component system alkaline phosphatase synthesis response regulator PhoP